MTPQASLIADLSAITAWLADRDLSSPDSVQQGLMETFPLHELQEVAAKARAGQAEGWLTPKRATDHLTFGRLAKPTDQTHGFSIDAVHMSGAGAAHTHPNGEISLCFTESGDPRFCGHPEGWVVVPPGSRHVPTVTDGTMLILYFLPQGAMTWG